MFLNKIIWLFSVPLFMINMSYTTGYVSEIINNTDFDLVLENRVRVDMYDASIPACGFVSIQVATIDLSTGVRKAPYIAKRELSFSPRTKNIITALEIPCVGPKCGKLGQYLGFSVITDYCDPCLLKGFCQCGDLLQVIKVCNKNVNNRIGSYSSNTQTTGIKIIDKAYYSVEVNQVSVEVNQVMTFNRKIADEFDFVFKQIEKPIEPSSLFTTSAKAVISHFTAGTPENGVTYAGIKFDKPTTVKFFQKFLTLIQRDKYLNAVAFITVYDQDQLIGLEFYTDITRDGFQKLLDKFNLAAQKN